MAKGFSVSKPAARNVNEGKRPEPMPAGKVRRLMHDEGKTLTDAASENMNPDYEVGGMEPESGGEDGERPVYADAIPWPAAKPVEHKPFKLSK